MDPVLSLLCLILFCIACMILVEASETTYVEEETCKQHSASSKLHLISLYGVHDRLQTVEFHIIPWSGPWGWDVGRFANLWRIAFPWEVRKLKEVFPGSPIYVMSILPGHSRKVDLPRYFARAGVAKKLQFLQDILDE